MGTLRDPEAFEGGRDFTMYTWHGKKKDEKEKTKRARDQLGTVGWAEPWRGRPEGKTGRLW